MKEQFGKYCFTDENDLILPHCEDVAALLKQTFWAKDRDLETIRKSMENSCCYAVFDSERDVIVAFARVITDLATVYYVGDVIVDEKYRKQGLSKKMMEWITGGDRRMDGQMGILITGDAQGLYARYGFENSMNNHLECMMKE